MQDLVREINALHKDLHSLVNDGQPSPVPEVVVPSVIDRPKISSMSDEVRDDNPYRCFHYLCVVKWHF